MSAGGIISNLLADGATPGRGTVGPVRVFVYGTFGSGSAQVQMQAPDDAWQDVDTALTADGEVFINVPPGVQNKVRVDLSGATAPDIDIWIQSALDT